MSGYKRKSRFLLHKQKAKRKMQCNLFTSKGVANAKNSIYKQIKCKKRNTANTRHTESLLYYYFARQGLTHSHSPNKPGWKRKKIKELPFRPLARLPSVGTCLRGSPKSSGKSSLHQVSLLIPWSGVCNSVMFFIFFVLLLCARSVRQRPCTIWVTRITAVVSNRMPGALVNLLNWPANVQKLCIWQCAATSKTFDYTRTCFPVCFYFSTV